MLQVKRIWIEKKEENSHILKKNKNKIAIFTFPTLGLL
jgi:hypothetical protein